jgi:hypothetical protein
MRCSQEQLWVSNITSLILHYQIVFFYIVTDNSSPSDTSTTDTSTTDTSATTTTASEFTNSNLPPSKPTQKTTQKNHKKISSNKQTPHKPNNIKSDKKNANPYPDIDWSNTGAEELAKLVATYAPINNIAATTTTTTTTATAATATTKSTTKDPFWVQVREEETLELHRRPRSTSYVFKY